MLRNTEFKQPETVRARRPPLPGARWPSRSLARRIALVQGNARQGPPTLRHQCQLVQDPLSLELNRRLVVKSRLSEVSSAVNAFVGPPHFFVTTSNLTTINNRTIGSVLTLHRHFHLSPLDPLAGKREGSAAGATCSVAQRKRGWSISPRLETGTDWKRGRVIDSSYVPVTTQASLRAISLPTPVLRARGPASCR